jgi:LAO/AO transport system kinase
MGPSFGQLVGEIAGGEGARRTRAAARLLTLLENDPERLPELFVGSESWPQPRLVLGVTGAPGSGK